MFERLKRLLAPRTPCELAAWSGATSFAVVSAAPAQWRCARPLEVAARPAATVDWTIFHAPGAVPAEHALVSLAETIAADDEVEFVFGDDAGPGREHWHKPGWSPALLLAQPYATSLFAVRTPLARRLGGLPAAPDDAARYDFVVRATAASRRVRHVPRVLARVDEAATVGANTAAAAERAASAAGLRARVTCSNGSSVHHVSVRPARDEPITAIVPTRDRLALLRPCVESVLASTREHVRVLIVDNGSREAATLAWLASLRANQRVEVLRDEAPFDYAALMNRSVAHARTPLVLLLNNDTRVIAPAWLDEMAGWLDLADVGAVGAKLYYEDDTIQHAGVLVGVGGVASHAHKRFPRATAGYHGLLHSVRDCSAVTGACLLTRRELFLAVGGMASELRVAYNDVDYCLRLRARGQRVIWTPLAELYHLEGQSRGTDAVRTARFEREIAYMRDRWPRELAGDPFHNPNLSAQHVDYRLRTSAS